jgi:hypothetical protein
MTKENAKRLHAFVVEVGKYIQNQLPPHPAHPHGRIGIAHIYSCIQSVFGVPMKECRDERFDDIIEVVQYIMDHATEKNSVSQALSHIAKEPVYKRATLEDFME